MNCRTGDLMKGIFQSYGTGYRSCHFCISYAYSWSFLFYQHVHNKAACWLLLAWAEYPFLLVQQVQWSAGFFLRGIHPLQGLSRGCSHKQTPKKRSIQCSLNWEIGWIFFFFFFLEIKRFKNQNSRDYEIPNSREMSFAKCVDLGTTGSRDLGSRDLAIARLANRENKNSVDLSIAKINITSLENPQ